jgi:hypothetical protein
VLDGVYTSRDQLTQAGFHEARPLTDPFVVELTALLQRRITRMEHDSSDPDDPLFAQLCAASVQGRVAM